jgi:hypothetical protein
VLEIIMRFAKIVFLAAGIWGVLIVTPMFFLYDYIGSLYPPALTHPDIYYGFVTVTLSWQIAFLIISTDPQRYRPIFPAAMLEKFGFIIAIAVLLAQGRVSVGFAASTAPDLVLGLLFVAAFVKTP